MLDWHATSIDTDLQEYLVAEGWTHSPYTNVFYLRVDRTQFDPVLSERENKGYRTIHPPFPAVIHTQPTDEVMMNNGVNWESGEIMITTPNWFLKQILVNISSSRFTTLFEVMTNDDVLIFGDDVDSEGNPKKWRITKIVKSAWYGNISLVTRFTAIALPGESQ